MMIRVRHDGMAVGQRGFTLLELVIVLSIMTLIVGIALPNVISLAQAEKRDATMDEMRALRTAIDAYAEDVGALPPDLDALARSSATGWGGPYIGDDFTGDDAVSLGFRNDEWRNAYRYEVRDATTATLRSRGENGRDDNGGRDDITSDIDITPVLRATTKQRMDIINTAILRYNATYLPDAPLPGTSSAIISTLQARGLLPAGSGWARDAFGDHWVPTSHPVSRVSSASFGAVPNGN